MRYTLLAGVAALALSAGIPFAYAQEHSGGAVGGAPATQAPAGGYGGETHHNAPSGSAGVRGGAAPVPGAGVSGSASAKKPEQGTVGQGVNRQNLGPGGAGQRHMGSSETNEMRSRGREETGQQRYGNGEREHNGMSSRENQTVTTHEHETTRAQLAPEQRTRFVSAIRKENVRTSEHVDFSVNVGIIVPGRYHFIPLPEDIISFVPEYRGYDYLVADGEIIIIDPVTRRIVAVIPEG